MCGVSIIIPTYNGGEIFKKLAKSIKSQDYSGNVQILIIDSGSTDGTVDFANKMEFSVITIPNSEFHHSKTRNIALQDAVNKYVVMMVQDCIPTSNQWLNQMVESIEKDEVAGVCVRQIPHIDAEIYARFEVDYHNDYLGNEVQMKKLAIESIDSMTFDEALKTIRFDNVCAIYNRELLVKNPFPVICFGEDMAWAKNILEAGYSIKYDPNIKVHHSHNRSPEYRFKRSLVDIVACAEVVGKLPQDLSFIKIRDYVEVCRRVEAVKNSIIVSGNIGNAINKSIPYRTIINKLPWIRKLYWKLLRLNTNHNTDMWISGFAKSAELHIKHVLEEIEMRYPDFSELEFEEIIDQVASQIQGRLLGEIYSSYILKGMSVTELQEVVEPYMKGI